MKEFDRLCDIALRADLTRAVLALGGPFAARFDAELRFYREVLGSAVTDRGVTAHLVGGRSCGGSSTPRPSSS
jgi:hypothetical protein